ncbi:MAG: hypothetical protein GWO20_11045 [Candidatus Korarchaeota archaeon]|nr:hypothetical protein [Candidatus Korarchaeota archaeon]NIU84811.1 hypothetical protein [Candidatus Thorarchaeota archaeon]NIW14142.1 hypothetical protein [Candidatus Thorarchaeota archaeon]NIW52865.1 hypothetical protein [Candidatus Korarchaeota archaeon]
MLPILLAYGILTGGKWVRKLDMDPMLSLFLLSLLFSMLSLTYGLDLVGWVNHHESERIPLPFLLFLPSAS